jgi:hypothetical protein
LAPGSERPPFLTGPSPSSVRQRRSSRRSELGRQRALALRMRPAGRPAPRRVIN